MDHQNPPTPPPSIAITILKIAAYIASPVLFWWTLIYLVQHIR